MGRVHPRSVRFAVEAFDDEVGIRVDADVAGDRHGFAGNGFSVVFGVQQGACGCKCVVAA